MKILINRLLTFSSCLASFNRFFIFSDSSKARFKRTSVLETLKVDVLKFFFNTSISFLSDAFSLSFDWNLEVKVETYFKLKLEKFI